MVMNELSVPVTQAEFAAMVGVSQQAVSNMVAAGNLPADGSALVWIRAYCDHLCNVAAYRMGNASLDLVQERAGLAKVQREAWALKNQQARADYAPVELLNEVLLAASVALNGEFEALRVRLPELLPELPPTAMTVVQQVLESARVEWLRSTAQLQPVKAPSDEDDAINEGNES